MAQLRIFHLSSYRCRIPFALLFFLLILCFVSYRDIQLQQSFSKARNAFNVLSYGFNVSIDNLENTHGNSLMFSFVYDSQMNNLSKEYSTTPLQNSIPSQDVLALGRPKRVLAPGVRLKSRRAKIQTACKAKMMAGCSFGNILKYRVYMFHGFNTAICTIAKAGSSTWRAHLRQVNKGPPFNVPIYEDDIRKAFLDRPLEKIIQDVNASSKIITVRHPLTRLVSAYRNKFQDGNPMPGHRQRAEEKKHKIRSGSYWDERFHQFWLPALFANNMVPSNTHVKVGLPNQIDPNVRYPIWVYERLYYILRPKISFVQFLRFVVQTFQDNNVDAHWFPYYKNCCPCHFDYDYVTKVETLTEDLEYVFKELGIPADPATSMNQQRKSVDATYKDYEYYRRVPVGLKQEIYRIIKDDMDLFGYELPRNFLY